MAKGSVRKKGKKWYYRFYVEDASGNLVQKEYAGTESKNETEKLLRQAMDDYESKKFIAKSENITVGELLDIWAEEELKTGTLSNGTVQNYLGAITNIKKHPISERKLKNVTSEHLQAFFPQVFPPICEDVTTPPACKVCFTAQPHWSPAPEHLVDLPALNGS